MVANCSAAQQKSGHQFDYDNGSGLSALFSLFPIGWLRQHLQNHVDNHLAAVPRPCLLLHNE